MMQRTLKDGIFDLIASGFYSGKVGFASGTWGTLLAMLLVWGLYCLDPSLNELVPASVIALLVMALGIISANYVCDRSIYGEGLKDPKQVVIDEIAGYFFAVAGLGTSFTSLFLAFLAFRFFDILKPFPIRNLEKLPRGYGIVLDDILAGIFANISIRLLVLIGLV